MKKILPFLLLFVLVTACNQPATKAWELRFYKDPSTTTVYVDQTEVVSSNSNVGTAYKTLGKGGTLEVTLSETGGASAQKYKLTCTQEPDVDKQPFFLHVNKDGSKLTLEKLRDGFTLEKQ